MDGMVFNVQRFSLQDGKGIRTTVFLKGCSLRCVWCHNPESQKSTPELAVYSRKCTRCGACEKVCSRTFSQECTACGKCLSVCKNDAREILGKIHSPAEIFDMVKRDKEYYITSGGGVTLSGGEPLLQADFCREILMLCHENGINTVIETAGNVPFSAFEKVLPYTDTFLFDLKAIDEKVHIFCTGSSNTRILQNASLLKEKTKNLLFRMPYIPHYNDGELPKIKAFVEDFPLELLPYHTIGIGKYATLGKAYRLSDVTPPSVDEMTDLARKYGVLYQPSGY